MQILLLTLSSILFIVSFGSFGLNTEKMENLEIGSLPKNQFLIIIGENQYCGFIPIIFLFIGLYNMLNISWYWVILISVINIMVLSTWFALIYSRLFGSKSDEIFSLRYGGYTKFNIYLHDFVISLILGIILLITGLCL